jgi:hypothetical protein
VRATNSITASEYWQTHEALRKTRDQTEFQRAAAVRAFEQEHKIVSWRIKITEVRQFGTIEASASRPGFWGEKFVTPLTIHFFHPKPAILGTLNRGDICVATGRPELVEEYESGTSETDWIGGFTHNLYLRDANIELADR